jgi:hypothetical protein
VQSAFVVQVVPKPAPPPSPPLLEPELLPLELPLLEPLELPELEPLELPLLLPPELPLLEPLELPELLPLASSPPELPELEPLPPPVPPDELEHAMGMPRAKSEEAPRTMKVRTSFMRPRMTGPSPLKRPFCRARQLVSPVYERCDICSAVPGYEPDQSHLSSPSH